MNGLMHIGFNNFQGGRSGDSSSSGLTNNLEALGFYVARMKTGTSARLDGRFIDFSKMDENRGDEGSGSFSYLNQKFTIKDPMNCFTVQTNPETHAILREGLEFSPLFTGRIKGRGPRYCPSIEDKIVTFKDKKSHQLFVEPEGRDTHEYYISGFASSLPLDVQLRALRTMGGLENVEIYRRVTLLNMTSFNQRNCIILWKPRKSGIFFLRGKSMEQPVMRRQQARG